MTTPSPQDQVLIDTVRAQMETQPWYARFSNTVTTTAGLLVLTGWVTASAGYSIPPAITAPVYGVIGVLTVLGVIRTKNGITPRQVDDLEVLASDRYR